MLKGIQQGIDVQTQIKGWCSCANGRNEYPIALKLSLTYMKGEEALKHLISYYKCPYCNGLIKTEES